MFWGGQPTRGGDIAGAGADEGGAGSAGHSSDDGVVPVSSTAVVSAAFWPRSRASSSLRARFAPSFPPSTRARVTRHGSARPSCSGALVPERGPRHWPELRPAAEALLGPPSWRPSTRRRGSCCARRSRTSRRSAAFTTRCCRAGPVVGPIPGRPAHLGGGRTDHGDLRNLRLDRPRRAEPTRGGPLQPGCTAWCPSTALTTTTSSWSPVTTSPGRSSSSRTPAGRDDGEALVGCAASDVSRPPSPWPPLSAADTCPLLSATLADDA